MVQLAPCAGGHRRILTFIVGGHRRILRFIAGGHRRILTISAANHRRNWVSTASGTLDAALRRRKKPLCFKDSPYHGGYAIHR